MPNATLTNILFAARTMDITICPGVKTRQLCPPGTPCSPRRTAGTRSSNGPVFSTLAAKLEKIFHKGVSALWSNDGKVLYAEVASSPSTEAYLIKIDGGKISVKESEHGPAWNLTIPMLLMALHDSNTALEYTKAATEKLIATMDKMAVTVNSMDLGSLCENFYYDWKEVLAAYGGEIETDDLTATDYTSVAQAVRTNSMTTIDTCLRDYIGTTFRNISVSAPAPTPSSPTTTTLTPQFIDATKSGEYVIGYEWEPDQEQHIRPLSRLDDYVPNETYRKLVALVSKRLDRCIERELNGKVGLDAIKNDFVNVIIGGRPGTGKTTTADALAATLGLPIYTTAVTRNTEEDTFEGMTKVNSDGKFLLHDTSFLNAYEHGGIVVVEEFNLADPGVLQGAIGQAIEYPFVLFKDGYKEVHRHPLCVIIGTMNSGTQGAREPNQAFTSRLPITLTMDDPDEATFLSILESHGHKKSLCKKVYKAYKSILNYLRDTANNEEMMLCVTMRHCLGALDLLSDEIVATVREAVYDTMIGSIGLRDMALAQETYEHAVMPLPLN